MFSDYWGSFAYNGRPRSSRNRRWPEYKERVSKICIKSRNVKKYESTEIEGSPYLNDPTKGVKNFSWFNPRC